MKKLSSLWPSKDGASAIEYAALLCMIAVVLVVSLLANGVNLSNIFAKASQSLSTDVGTAAPTTGGIPANAVAPTPNTNNPASETPAKKGNSI